MRTQVRFGDGRIAELPEILDAEAIGSVALVVDTAIIDSEHFVPIYDELKTGERHVRVLENEVSEPTYSYLESVREQLKGETFDVIVAIGGGSTMDLAKGVAILLKNEGPALEYRGFPDLNREPIPVIAVPTTAGTGSEVTFNAVFTENATDPRESRKLGINSRRNYPKYAILDAELTLSCPVSVTVSSGMDALVHTLESFAADDATHYSRMFSREAFKLLATNLPGITSKLGDIETRRNILLGSHYAGAALVNSGAGPAGALSYPLGSRFGVPHGIAGGVFLPVVVRFNVEHGYKGYNELHEYLPNADIDRPPEEKAKAFVHFIEELCDGLGVPTDLTELGVPRAEKEFIIERAMEDLKAAFEQNPVEISESDTRAMIDSLL
jgi:alcohol dehydrogenase